MSAEQPGSITRWLDDLKAGRPEAVNAIWRCYYDRVLALARHRLRQAPHQAVEEVEDVALSAFNGLADGAARGQFDHLEDRGDLWRVLATITVHKALQRGRRYDRWKRSGRPAVANGKARPADDRDVLEMAVSNEPVPEITVMLRDQVDRLLAVLDDPILRQIAEWRMEGLANDEIAHRLGRAVRTVERKVELIRLTWESLDGDADGS